MKKRKTNRIIIPYPKDRRLTTDLFAISLLQPNIHGLSEFDVTDTLKKIKALKKKGSEISFLAFTTNCLAHAVDNNKTIQGMKKGRKKIVLFDDVDVCLILSVEKAWRKVPLAHIIRKANEKSLAAINIEVQQIKNNLENKYREMEKTINSLLKVPGWFRRKFLERKYRHDPDFRKKNGGTVCLTSLGPFFAGKAGWGIPVSSNPLYIILGGIEEKPVVRDDEITKRKMLSVTAVFNHDITDGIQAIEFIKEFGELIEKGFALEVGK
jgi:pyruvate/2-oxoglutarate dehydrogenase complex dihydrolipoamide acyltransferase (E2) component